MEPFLFKVTSVYPYIHGALHELGRGKHHVGGSRPQVPGDDPRSLLTIKEGTVLPTPCALSLPLWCAPEDGGVVTAGWDMESP